MDTLKDKIEEFKANPDKIFGLIYPYVLVVIISIGLYFVTNLGNVARQSIPLVAADTTAQMTELPVKEPRKVPPIDIMQMSKPTKELVDKGKETFKTVCSSCHGEDGRGNGPASTGLNPPPRNFHSKEDWVNSPKLSGIYTTLEKGIQGSGMISYEYLPPADRIALAHYIRQTFVPDPPQDSDSELQQLDQLYSLSQGKEIPAQIPVDAAMRIIEEENSTQIQNIKDKVKQTDTNDAGAKLFSEVTSDKFKALSTLNADKSWKQGHQKFVSAIIYNIDSNGFNSKIYKLSSDEWDLLFNYMNRVL